MNHLTIAPLAIGFIVLAISYRKNNRSILPLSALLLLAAGLLPGFIVGH